MKQLRQAARHWLGGARVSRHADGSVSVGDESYRLESEGPARYALVRQRDNVRVARLVLQAHPPGPPELKAERIVDSRAARAVRQLMSEPRGLLPLQ